MRKRIKVFLLFMMGIIIFFSNLVNVDANEETDLKLHARSAILIDADSGRVLYEENADAVLPIASTTKILTCIIALESGRLDEKVLVSKEAERQPKVKLYLKEGEEYLLKDLLYSLMLESHNDTAVAIAEYLGGSIKGFSAMMNQKAEKLGCRNSYFITPNGLDAEKEGKIHSSTARDMARITAYAICNQDFLKITGTRQYSFSSCNGLINHTVNNKDAFLQIYQGAIGVKTGFTGNAGYCFVGAVKREDRTFISVVLGCGWPPNKKWKWQDTGILMDYGVDNYHIKTFSYDMQNYDVEIIEGSKEFVTAERKKYSIDLLVSAKDMVECYVSLPEKITAPIQKGSYIGYEQFLINGTEYKKIPIYTTESVPKWDFSYAWELIMKHFWLS